MDPSAGSDPGTPTIEWVALRLKGLTVDVERRAAAVAGVPTPGGSVRAEEARRTVARTLRFATQSFLAAFERRI
jgi:hypothetical protein